MGTQRCRYQMGTETCQHMTSNRSGICTQHEEMLEEQGSGGFTITDRRKSVVANPLDRRPSASREWMGDDLPALPDLPQNEILRPEHFTLQIDNLVSTSAILHLKRNVLNCIQSDGTASNEALGDLHSETLRKYATISPRPVSDEMALELSRMVQDEFGPDEEDATYLAGYALSKKWQMGVSSGADQDDLGIAYGGSYAEYVAAHNKRLQTLASDMFIHTVTEDLSSVVAESQAKTLTFESISQMIGSSKKPAQIQDPERYERMEAQRKEAERQRKAQVRQRMLAESNRLRAEVEESKRQSRLASAAHEASYAQHQMNKNLKEINDKLG